MKNKWLVVVLGIALLQVIALSETKVHEMTVTLTIPPAIEIRVDKTLIEGVLSLSESEPQKGFEAMVPITLCTNAPPTDLLLFIDQSQMPAGAFPLSLLCAFVPGNPSPLRVSARWTLIEGLLSGVSLATYLPGEHPFTLFLKIRTQPGTKAGMYTLPLTLSAQDVRGTWLQKIILLTIRVQ